jgi:glycosyltransferase involved in cell wall biosynthesis
MNILFLTQIIPYPLDAGPKVKTWHVLRYLADQGHQITLASFVRQEEEKYIAALEQVCASVYPVPLHRSRWSDILYWLRSNISGRPFLIERDDLATMRNLVKGIMASKTIDVIHADQLTMTQFALPFMSHNNHPDQSRILGSTKLESNGPDPDLKQPILVFDAHNAVWTVVERMRQNAPWIMKPLAKLEAKRVKRYEGMIVGGFDHTLAVTELDCQALHQAYASIKRRAQDKPPAISVVPITVDTLKLKPINRLPGSLNILTLGTLHYPPNADGIRWFMNEVFPLILHKVPKASLTILGKNPPQDFLNAAENSSKSIKVTGYVPDLVPYMKQAALMVIPVRAGGGMRVRILEAFSRAMPVVTTSIGLEGIRAVEGHEVLIRDTAEEFAAAVVWVLGDADLQARLANNARRLAQQHYDWQVALKKMEVVYHATP